MTRQPETQEPAELKEANGHKLRHCLRCQSEFQSEWAGERICGRCKNTTAWRAGTPLRSFPTNEKR